MTTTLVERARRYATKAHAAIDQRRKYPRPRPAIDRGAVADPKAHYHDGGSCP